LWCAKSENKLRGGPPYNSSFLYVPDIEYLDK